MSSPWLEVVGWAGSAVLIVSLLQSRVLRLRQLNLVASVVLVFYNAVVGVWPMLGMNLAIVGINLWHLAKLRREGGGFSVVEVRPDDPVLAGLLARHGDDIARFNPGTDLDAPDVDLAGLVLRGDETVGVVLARDDGGGTARIVLDYVTPRYRDVRPGRHVYGASGFFTDRGYRRVVAPTGMRANDGYLHHVGFRRVGDDLAIDLPGAPAPEPAPAPAPGARPGPGGSGGR